MIGIPGSGKSFIAKRISEIRDNVKILSSDALREEIWGSTKFSTSKNVQVFTLINERLKSYLESGHDVIIDATNLYSKDRKSYIKLAHSINTLVYAIVVNTPFDICLANNSKRLDDSHVPYDVLVRMSKQYNKTLLELTDFDKTFLINKVSDIKKIPKKGTGNNK